MFKTAAASWHYHARNRPTKTMLVMKLTFLFLIGFFMNARSELHSQTITLAGNNLPIKTVFSEVKKQTGYLVAGRADLLAELGTVSISVKDMELQEFLQLIFKDKPVAYRFEKKTIVLTRKQPLAPEAAPVLQLTLPQNPPASGLVYSDEGLPLGGVSVVVKRTKKGTVTDSKGSFSIEAETGDILSISFVGYSNQEVKVTGITLLIRLKVSHAILDETQITAYGKTSKRLSTGSIGTVKAEDIEKQPVMTVLDAIAGRVPGILINPVSGNSAAPVSVSIRGRNGINPLALADPLYVIDGMPMSTQNASPLTGHLPVSMGAVQGGVTNTSGENPLLSIHPRDIESISILKDADATAIYGSRGANGVILITTKKAKSGPASFNLNVSNGIRMLARFPKLMKTEQYLAVRREAFQNDGILPDATNAPDLVTWDPNKYTDWQRELAGTGSYLDVNASVSGGMPQSAYRLSASYGNQKEVMNNGGKNIRGTFSSNFSHTSRDQKFDFGISNSLTLTEVNAFAIVPPGGLAPNAPDIYNENGEFNFEPYRIQNISAFPFNALKRPSKSKTFSFRGLVDLKYEILKGLTLSAKAGYMFSSNDNSFYMPAASIDPIMSFFSIANADYGKSISKNWQVEPQLQYNTYIGKGNLSVQLISNLQTEISSSESIHAEDFPNDAMMKSHNNAKNITITEGYKEYKYLSVSGIVRYAWDNKYILSLNARRDGSSRFGPGRQFGNFGSVALAWIASDEKWMKAILPSWFSFLKLRGSYGTTGSDPSANYEYLSRWARNSILDIPYTLFNYNGIDAFHMVTPLNQDFRWEATTKAQLAATFGFWQDRINLDVEFYQNNSGNQLASMPIPSLTGFKTALTNWPAEVRNSGIEISSRARIIESKNWNLSLNFNVGHNRNKLMSFPNLEKSSFSGKLKVGYSTTSRILLHYTGIDPLTGSYTFEDRNKDGKVTAGFTTFPNNAEDDRYVLIETLPKYSGGFGFQLGYKELSISSQFYFVNKLRSDPYLNSVPGMMYNMPMPDEIKNNHWQQPGDQVKYPRYTTNASNLGPLYASDGSYSNGSYLRWQNLSVSWRLPTSWLNRIKMKNANISIDTQNLLVISAYKDLDPEIIVSNFSSPTPRIITTRISFTF
ncbi:SusC/RagA family TonB-linked outer membrane protein [Pseudobacter ginsenosidimutans]|uniref:TonB-linked SusC/RagA family outer membrane protein n=1 Tax=Pseudobacter ginsenosidimutans TaxID=661488 RepID=A0A4Q7N5A4_9BACT|nr:SusC/RagA family TonB-linked outer membrane protein [Pseudobacter ginsenosidimutans]QEC44730.1 SusC/RagA family TonB-linked outer membrane protein [Pseudobacter ginsenosidimutans]RZS76211.1 TonB-linked SusC/RagA family outer membrane protein [Pseudobacter ginsenosidimutans]